MDHSSLRPSRLARRPLLGLVIGGLLAIGAPARAGTLIKVEPPPVSADLPGVTIQLPGGREQVLSLRELESLGVWQVRTSSPWEKGELTLEGPLLRDVLAHAGVEGVPRIVIRALDDFVQEIPHADWHDFPVILATRADGKPLGRRQRGPTRIVYPLIDHPELATYERRVRWVWMIASIEIPG